VTHRANSPEFYGQITAVDGSNIKRLTNITLVR
jgi:hypothetical protein